MRLPVTLRRVALVAATSSLLVGLPAVAAQAVAPTVTNVSPAQAANTGTFAFDFDVADTFITVPSKPTVTLKRTDDTTDSIPVDPANVTITSNTHFHVTADFTRRNPGTWDIVVAGSAGVPPVSTTDSCSACFLVLAFSPTATAISATTAGGPSTTVGGGATNIPFTITGTQFTNSVYCSVGPCTGQPTVSVSGTGVNLSGSGTNGAEVNATATTITKKITVDPGAAPGPRDIIVTNTDHKVGTCSGCLIIGPTPTLTLVTPNELANGASGRMLVLTGSNFAGNAAVTITPLTGTANGVTYTTKTVDSSTQITLTGVAVAASTATAPVAFRNITVTNPDSGSVTQGNLFQVMAIPTVTSVAYTSNSGVNSYGQGALHRTLTVTGTGFQSGAVVTLATPPGITINTTTVTVPNTITLDVTLNQVGASPPSVGTHAITVTNPDGGVSGSATNFTVTTGPSIATISPASRARGATASLTIAGKNFAVSGVTVRITDATVDDNSVVVSAADGQGNQTITFNATMSNALNVAGVKNVSVLNNNDKGLYVCAGCFSIDNLQTNSVSPSVVLNDLPQQLTISGVGFANDAVATLVKTGAGAGLPDLTGTSATVSVDGTSLTATFPFSGAAPGGYLVRVTNPTNNPGVGTCTCTVTVVGNAPGITTLSPASRGSGASGEVLTFTGTNFLPGATVTFDNAGIHVDGTPTVTPTQITVTVHIDPSSEADPLAVPPPPQELAYVTNTDGQTDSAPFTVNAGPGAASLDKSTRGQDTATTLVMTADGTVAGATLLFSGTGISASNYVFTAKTNPTEHDKLSATVTVSPTAATGPRTVTVRNPDGGRSSCTNCLTINPKPTVTAATPLKVARGATTPGTITGTGFASGATVTVSGTGVTATVTNVTPTTLTVSWVATAGADRTVRDITVTNTDAGNAALASAFTVFSVPDAPTGVSATPGAGKATVSWTAPAVDGGDPITGYTVTSSPGGITKSVAANVTSTDVTGLTNGTAYTFTVVATNSAGNSAASAPSNSVTPVSIPDAPTNVTATRGNTKATVSWTAPASNGGSALTGYTVTSSPGGITKTVAGNVTSTDVTGLTNGTAYTFTVVATNAQGDSAPSAASNSVTPATVPGAPTGVDASPSDASAFVTWVAPSSNGGDAITGYTVTSSPEGHTANVDGNTLQASVPGLTNGTAYTFTVTATNTVGTGPASAASPSVTPAQIPGAPTNVQATAGNASAHVTWTAPTTGGPVTGYTVTSSPGGITKSVNGSTLAADVTGLTNGTSYTFTVVATNQSGSSNPSAASGSVTPMTVPDAPTGVTATRGNSTAHVTWTAPASNGGSTITGYTVTSSPGSHTANVNGTTTAADVPGLVNGTSYTFTVVATNSVGNSVPSAASNAVTPATVPNAPSTVTAVAGHAAATVSWSAAQNNGSPVTSYTVTSSPGGITKTVSGITSTTMTGLTNGTLYTFAVTATNGVGTGPAGTSNAVRPTWVTTLTETATTKVAYAGTATVKGKLTRSDGAALSGVTVRIYAKVAPATTYSLVRTLTTTSTGAYSSTFNPKKNVKFQARFLGTTGFAASSSPIRTTSVAYRVTTAWSQSGRTVTVTGGVAPSAAGRTIYLWYRRSDGSIVSLASATISGSSTYKLTRTFGPGTYTLFVHIGSSTTNVATSTPFHSVKIT
jgi:hypothetical protein